MNKVTEKMFPKKENENLEWRETNSKHLFHTPIFDASLRHRVAPDGRESDFIILNNPEWVSVIPYFKGTDGKDYFIMEHQYRHGSCSVTVEFPGGLVENGEDPQDAALRELKEETGIVAHKIKKLGCINPNAAFMDNHQHVFLAEELENSGVTNFDANEEINAFAVPVCEVLSGLGKEPYGNGIMMLIAYYFLKEKDLIKY